MHTITYKSNQEHDRPHALALTSIAVFVVKLFAIIQFGHDESAK